MKLFNWFKKKPKLKDEFSEELEYIIYKDESGYFSGSEQFQNRNIDVLITVNEDGPTEEQKEFLKMLDKTYESIKKDIILPYLKTELSEYVEEAGLNDFDNSFELESISIEAYNNDLTEWSISYYSNPMKHSVTVYFTGMKPHSMTMDG